MTTDKATGVAAGRELFDRLHTRKERPSTQERGTPREKDAAPKRGTKGVAAGRALYESEGRWDPADLQTGEEGTEV